jgi:hypothetical protein
MTNRADIAAIVGLFLRVGAAVGVFLLLAGLILADAGCVKQWGSLSEVAERVISSCSGRKCAPETAQAKCLRDMRENAQAQRDSVPASCFMWNTP